MLGRTYESKIQICFHFIDNFLVGISYSQIKFLQFTALKTAYKTPKVVSRVF